MKEVLAAAEDAAAAYETFVRSQLAGENPVEFKRLLLAKFGHAREKCDRFLAESYFGELPNAKKFDDWKRSHQPFHWFVEFFGILNTGGFDVVIGNPPYVEYTKVKKEYMVKNYATEQSANLYAFVTERSLNLLSASGDFGFIVPISVVCTQRMRAVQDIISRLTHSAWFSLYAEATK